MASNLTVTTKMFLKRKLTANAEAVRRQHSHFDPR
jgi:hypothetical protein